MLSACLEASRNRDAKLLSSPLRVLQLFAWLQTARKTRTTRQTPTPARRPVTHPLIEEEHRRLLQLVVESKERASFIYGGGRLVISVEGGFWAVIYIPGPRLRRWTRAKSITSAWPGVRGSPRLRTTSTEERSAAPPPLHDSADTSSREG